MTLNSRVSIISFINFDMIFFGLVIITVLLPLSESGVEVGESTGGVGNDVKGIRTKARKSFPSFHATLARYKNISKKATK